MKELIEILNQTSPERTFLYIVAFIICLYIIVEGLVLIVEGLRK
jgi:hypothetical protein